MNRPIDLLIEEWRIKLSEKRMIEHDARIRAEAIETFISELLDLRSKYEQDKIES